MVQKKTKKMKKKVTRKAKKAIRKSTRAKKGKKTGGKKGKKVRAAKTVKKAKTARKPITAQSSEAISNASAAVMEHLIGKVVHYYDRIGVAIIDLKEPLNVGDMVMLKKGDRIVPQRVESIQIEHTSVTSAKPGDVVGVKVDTEAYEGTVVLPG